MNKIFKTTHLSNGSTVCHCTESVVSCDPIWEAAYERFETTDEEVQKFLDRLRYMKLDRLDKASSILEIFCGRGNGIVAFERLGFHDVEGVDLSFPLLEKYSGLPRNLYVADCRQMPFDDHSKDLIIVQGGLHHLPLLPSDVEQTCYEVKRVLKPGGRFAIVEPYPTICLPWIHFVSELSMVRCCLPKLDALAVMTERERTTYQNWMKESPGIRQSIKQGFKPIVDKVTWTKWMFVGMA